MTDKEQKLKDFKDSLIQLSEGITKSDFVKSFQKILKITLSIEKQLIGKINAMLEQAIDSFKSETEALKKTTQANLSDLTSKYGKSIDKALKEQENGLNFLRDKARSLESGRDGEDGYSPVKGVDYFDGENGSPDSAEEIRNKLEKLKGDERLKIEAIDELEERLKDLEERPLGGKTGGGFSKIAMDGHIIDPYTPTGDVDGVNTDFVLICAPSPTTSLKVYQDGQKQQLTTDYTLSSKTITFLIAPLTNTIIEVEHRA